MATHCFKIHLFVPAWSFASELMSIAMFHHWSLLTFIIDYEININGLVDGISY